MHFDDLVGPLDDERAAQAGELLRGWLGEADRDVARPRFLALKDAWQYLGAAHREALLAEAHQGLAGAPDAELKAATLGLLDA